MVVCLSVLVLQQTDNLSSVYLSPYDSRDRLQPQRNPEMDKQKKNEPDAKAVIFWSLFILFFCYDF